MTELDGQRAATIYSFPGPVHEGNGTMQLIVDKRADARQREALVKILNGEETEEMATMWWAFSAMSPNKLDPSFESIYLDVDVDARNPVTGMEHRVRIDLPNGFEFRLAEIGSGWTRTSGTIKLDLTDTYGQFARIHLSNKGVIDDARL